jgi:threonine synthase
MTPRPSSKRFSTIRHFKQHHALGAINSINWVRVLAQIVYYFYAYFQVQRETGAETGSVQCADGQFWRYFCRLYARKRWDCRSRLILATNSNNILSRFVNQGDYSLAAGSPVTVPFHGYPGGQQL